MITKIIKRLRKKIRRNKKDIRLIITRIIAIEQEQTDMIQRFEKHIAYHIDREILETNKNVMCH